MENQIRPRRRRGPRHRVKRITYRLLRSPTATRVIAVAFIVIFALVLGVVVGGLSGGGG
jgi:hypothetical protein